MAFYINATPNESGNYGNPMGQPFAGCLEMDERFLPAYLAAMGFVHVTADPEDGVTVTAVETHEEALNAYLAANPAPDALGQAKEEKIARSKTDLAQYLEEHPLLWTDGEYYAITAEKQAQLTSKIMAATMAQTMSQPYDLTWNSTGEVCKAWTLQDLSVLAFAIDARVTALVSYQQSQEVAMKNAETMEALEAVVVDYDSVPLA